MREKTFRRPAEQLLDDARRRRGAGDLLLHTGAEPVRLPLLGVRDIALALEHREHGEHRVMREVVVQASAHFGDGRGSALPKNCHHVELAVGERRGHRTS